MTNRRLALTALALLATVGPVRAGPGHAKPHGPVLKEQTDWGIAGDAKAAKRTIEITMLDTMRFSPDNITVRQGETVKLVLKNKGKLLHELVLGTPEALAEHAALMVKFPNMEHDAPYMAHVASGKSSSIVWTFNRPGNFDFSCLVAGHYQAGMTGNITVTTR